MVEHCLAEIGLLQGLEERARRELELRCRWLRVNANEQIIDRESDSRDVYFIVSGRARVVNYSLSGREITFDEFGPGDYFGELAAIDGQPRSANVVALTDVFLAKAAPQTFISLVTSHPTVCERVLESMARVVRTSSERIMDLSTLGANNRVFAEILRLARANEAENGTAAIKPIPLHADVASRVSTTRETVARVFGDLTRRGLLDRQKDRIIVRDMEELEEMVDQFRHE